ncbi:MAG: DsbA family protein [Gammaproteobacteria bacterium]|jgi:thiol:disulfide interchange protein DsbA|nr:DsbA family protein [Gammaproteobacteria bacterium]
MKCISPLALILLVTLLAGCGNSDKEQVASQPAPDAQQASATLDTTPAEVAEAVAEPVAEAVEAGEGELGSEPQASTEIRLAQATPTPLATRFVAGKHYTLINPAQPTVSAPDQVEVTEFFYYTCPHCYNFEPFVQTYLARKPAYVNFVRVPAVFNPGLELYARAYYAAEAMGILEKTHGAMFKEIHVKRNMMTTEDAIVDFYISLGVDGVEFRKTFNSFAVDTKLRQGATMARRFKITGVPTVVVNGKYMTGGSLAGSYETLLEIIDELVMIEHTR